MTSDFSTEDRTTRLAKSRSFYDKHWEDLPPIGTYKVARLVWILQALVKIRKQLRSDSLLVVDLGCGDGRLAPLWKEMTGGETYALDLSPKAIERARRLYPDISYVEGDACNTQFSAEMFDLVISQELIEHLDDQVSFVNECNRIIRPDGYLIVTTPNKFYFDRVKGGLYSKQPIEKIMDRSHLVNLLSMHFDVLSIESLIVAKGDYGVYRLLTSQVWKKFISLLRLSDIWNLFLEKWGYGLHLAVVCRKIRR